MRNLSLTMALLVCASCLPAQTPDWVKGKSREYQEEFYLTGVGSGDTRQDAESQARTHIAEVFKVRITADISVNKSETIKGSGSNVSGETTEVTRSRIDMGLKKTLEGTEIAEVWQDPNDATYYALAVLDREKASMKFSDRIRELDREILRLGSISDSSTTRIGKLKILLLKKRLISERLEFDSDLRIVSSSGKGIDPPFSFERENSELNTFLRDNFVVDVSGEGPGSDVMVQTVTDILTSNGFSVKQNSEKEADLVIRLMTSIEPSDQPVDEWYYTRWHLRLNTSDAAKGEVMVSSSENGKSGQLSRDESQKRAIFDMNRRVAGLTSKILEALTGTED